MKYININCLKIEIPPRVKKSAISVNIINFRCNIYFFFILMSSTKTFFIQFVYSLNKNYFTFAFEINSSFVLNAYSNLSF